MFDFVTAFENDVALWSTKTDEKDKRKFVWLSGSNFPIDDAKGICALLRYDEQMSLPMNADFFAEWFDLSDPIDLEKYKQVWQRAVDQWYSILAEENLPGPQGQMVKFLRYTVPYYHIPPYLANQLATR